MFGDGRVARLDNFRRTELWRGGARKRTRAGPGQGPKACARRVRARGPDRQRHAGHARLADRDHGLHARGRAQHRERPLRAGRGLGAGSRAGDRLTRPSATSCRPPSEPHLVCPTPCADVARGGPGPPRGRLGAPPLARPSDPAGRARSLAAAGLDPGLRKPARSRLGPRPARRGEGASAAHRRCATLAGRFRLFDREREDLSDDPDWFLDPRTGRRAPDATYAFDIDCRDVGAVGTIKYVWEPSRHHQLTVLAAAYFLTGDERYADLAAAQLRSWWRRNPFLSGVHWTSGIELGVRLLSWVWVRRLLDGWSGVKALFDDNPDFLRQLHHHQDYLARLRSHGSSANNHLIAEEAGQFAACCAFPYFAETAKWREHAARSLRREVQIQTFECGLNRELASSYHVFVLELLLAAAIEGEAAGCPLGAAVWQRLCAMTDALAATLDVQGRPPRQGDGDQGRGPLLDGPEADPCASLLATGAALFGACDWWPNQGSTDLRTLLWRRLAGGKMPAGERPAHAAPPLRGRRHGPAARRSAPGGRDLVPLRSRAPRLPVDRGARACRRALDRAALRRRRGPGRSRHLHLPGRGGLARLFPVDPRPQLPRARAAWTSRWRAARSSGSARRPPASSRTRGLDAGPEAIWRAAHDGYGRLSPAARHERTVTLDREARRLVIEDLVESTGRHACRLAFHLGPEVDCRLEGHVAELAWRTGHRRWRALMRLPRGLDWSAARGQSEPPLGWYSPCFGARQPIVTLIGRGTVAGGQRLTTDLQIELGARHAQSAKPGRMIAADGSADQPEARPCDGCG